MLLFSLVSIMGCISDSSKLTSFFEELEESIGNELIINEIKTISKDSLRYILPVFEIESKQLIQKLHYEKELNGLMNPHLAKPFSSSRGEVLLFAFQKHLNRENISLREIQIEIQEVKKNLKEKMVKEEAFYEKELNAIIRTNNLKWQEGDTLNLILQIQKEDNHNSIYYRGYPQSLDYSSASDTLRMKGLLLNKHYPVQNKMTDSVNLSFNLKILELSHTNVYNFAEPVKLGDDFVLSLEAYGRLID